MEERREVRGFALFVCLYVFVQFLSRTRYTKPLGPPTLARSAAFVFWTSFFFFAWYFGGGYCFVDRSASLHHLPLPWPVCARRVAWAPWSHVFFAVQKSYGAIVVTRFPRTATKRAEDPPPPISPPLPQRSRFHRETPSKLKRAFVSDSGEYGYPDGLSFKVMRFCLGASRERSCAHATNGWCNRRRRRRRYGGGIRNGEGRERSDSSQVREAIAASHVKLV